MEHVLFRFTTKSYRMMYYTYIKEYELKMNPNTHAITDMGRGRDNWVGGEASGVVRRSNADIYYDKSDGIAETSVRQSSMM